MQIIHKIIIIEANFEVVLFVNILNIFYCIFVYVVKCAIRYQDGYLEDCQLILFELCHEKICLSGFRRGPPQTWLYNHRR